MDGRPLAPGAQQPAPRAGGGAGHALARPLGPPVGGPLGTTNVVVYYLFEKGFDAGGNMGYASAVALVLFAVILALTLFQRKVVESRVHYA